MATSDPSSPAIDPAPTAVVDVNFLSQSTYITSLLEKANQYMDAIGYTEHGVRHAERSAQMAGHILGALGYPERQSQLAGVAAYLHDIGNVVSRDGHHISGAQIAFAFLGQMKMPVDELTDVVSAIGNHEESVGSPVTPVAAAVIIADKADVHRSRVQNPEIERFDIHDRVNWSAVDSGLLVDPARKSIALELTIDTSMSSVMEYFEIFLNRMVMCRGAAEALECKFGLTINGQRLG